MRSSENVTHDVFELSIAILADDAEGTLRAHDKRRFDRLSDVRDAVRIRASEDADRPVREGQGTFLRDVVVPDHVHGGGGGDECDLVELPSAELAVLDLGSDLRHSREGMHDDESALRVPQHVHVDTVGSGDLLVFLGVGEPFLLDPGDVQDVRVPDHFLEAVCRPEREPFFLHLLEDLRRHLEGRRAHEREVSTELRERVRERVDRAAVLQIADEGDVLALERAFLVPDRVQVEERLRRMLARTVAGVDHRLLGEFRGETRGALARVAKHDRVAVRLDHPDPVREGLPLLDRGTLRAGETQVAPEGRVPRTAPRPAHGFGSLRPNWVTFEGRITIPPSASMYRFQSFVFCCACFARSTAIVATTFRTTSSTSTPRISRNRYFIRSRSMVSRTIRGRRIRENCQWSHF